MTTLLKQLGSDYTWQLKGLGFNHRINTGTVQKSAKQITRGTIKEAKKQSIHDMLCNSFPFVSRFL